MGHAEWLGLLIDREVANRTTKRFQARMRAAKLRPGVASVEDVDFRSPRRLDKALFQELATGRWIKEKRNLLITGPSGVGETWLACALGQRACRDNATVIYKRLAIPEALFRNRQALDLRNALGKGRLVRCRLGTMDRRRLLGIDPFR